MSHHSISPSVCNHYTTSIAFSCFLFFSPFLTIVNACGVTLKLQRYEPCHVCVVRAAGWSNVATSFAGAGFTGSYIFSQTIFTMRAGVNLRINGFIIALMMLAIFVAPFSVIEYLPSYFFGSLMIWIGWEIARVRFV